MPVFPALVTRADPAAIPLLLPGNARRFVPNSQCAIDRGDLAR
ncbi:hypothetical protein ABIF65_001750 [Bradyrhizobium japonicum]|nr:hypothetical protein [Bradyrhizobium japonicum]MCP1778478.1 hypothetical protein [Bradyrhizobium japonicum]MCP1857920.1 hypothetical protein [Bradyrhizobium japonicum]MCP1888734.1 hypothetical protein [Bradyrhizobium japonicum]MCW2321710.1 hypothetical protein [Bradyrhizobium japonicum]